MTSKEQTRAANERQADHCMSAETWARIEAALADIVEREKGAEDERGS